MRFPRFAIAISFIFICCILSSPLRAQDKADGPTDAKAQKTYNEARQYLKDRNEPAALDAFKKADKQDGGHCFACQKRMVKYGIELSDWKVAETAAEEEIAEAKGDRDTALAHYELAIVLIDEGNVKHKDDCFARAHDELTKALVASPNFPDAIYEDGRVLAKLHQDDAAKASFAKYIAMRPDTDRKRQRAQRYLENPELARARMAPPFTVTTMDGQQISLDDLTGKVVLLDFWATWCGPCREALPHIRDISKKFQGQPLVILSINLDKDEQKWRDFVDKNQMTWLQARDGGFDGKISRMFDVNAIPHTFTIDADGVLQDEHVGDEAMEGKIKKLLARARELQQSAAQPSATKPGS
jgi:thiol-disulfide isomerase/thioredoxin